MKKLGTVYVAALLGMARAAYAADTTPPSVPGHVAATPLSPTRMALTWEKSTDDVFVDGYKIYRDGALFITVGPKSGGTFPNPYRFIAVDTSLHSYSVSSFDSADNESAPSRAVSARGLAAPRPRSTVYVDHRLSENITDGTYSISSRAPGGSDGNAYRTVQAGVAAMNPGDHVLLRGGTYWECDIDIPRPNNGSSWNEGGYSLLASYPGEWARIHAGYQHSLISGYGATALKSWGTAVDTVQYWRFERLEITGAGRDPKDTTYDSNISGHGVYFWPARDIEFRYCYIHHNHGGASPNGGSGITLQGAGGGGAQRVKILYCLFDDNGWPGNGSGNLQNINIYSDYRHDNPKTVDLATASKQNEIAYNLVKGSNLGIKMKGKQWMVQDVSGNLSTSMDGKDQYDEIHHNIVVGARSWSILYGQDFQQVHHNIVDARLFNANGIFPNTEESGSHREIFYAVVYNNTILGEAQSGRERGPLVFQHGKVFNASTLANYDELVEGYHPYLWCLNNLVYRVSGDGEFALQLNTTYGINPTIAAFDWDTIHVAGNYFADRSAAESAIRLGNYNDDMLYSSAQFEQAGFGTKLYQQAANAADLFADRDLYITNPHHRVGSGAATIADGGAGGPHPYLDGITIPSYVGATKPGDARWVKGVQDIGVLDGDAVPVSLRDAVNGSIPPWVEAADPARRVPAAPRGLRAQ